MEQDKGTRWTRPSGTSPGCAKEPGWHEREVLDDIPTLDRLDGLPTACPIRQQQRPESDPTCIHRITFSPLHAASHPDSRFSTYSAGAPSLHPSVAPTLSTQATSNRSSTHAMMNAHRASTASHRSPSTISEKSHAMYSNPSAASTATLHGNDPKAADIKSWSGALDRMHDSRLDRQRYVLSPHKSEEVSKLALGAKVERALSRRMVGQDASFSSKKPYNEKRGLEVKAG
nr:hypothetical protein CFP56_08991 [Quercus suber]